MFFRLVVDTSTRGTANKKSKLTFKPDIDTSRNAILLAGYSVVKMQD